MNVTDADRKAAYALLLGSLSWFYAKPVLDGEMDSNPVVQAFACHRELGRREGLEEAAKVADKMQADAFEYASKDDACCFRLVANAIRTLTGETT